MSIQTIFFHAQTHDGDKCLPDTCGTEIDISNEAAIFAEAARTAEETIANLSNPDGWEIYCKDEDGDCVGRYSFDDIEERLIAETITSGALKSIDSESQRIYGRVFTIDASELADYCYQGALDNIANNGGADDFSDWIGGAAGMAEVYLDGDMKRLPEWIQRKVIVMIEEKMSKHEPEEAEAA